MIKVCDAIMGTGKTSAAINLVKDNPSGKYLYVTPYNNECARFADDLKDYAAFSMAQDNLKEYNFRKTKHLQSMIKEGLNVAVSHNLFRLCDSETVQSIKDQGYTVIIDEVLDVFTQLPVTSSDIRIIIDSGWLVEEENEDGSITYMYDIESADKQYRGGKFWALFTCAGSKRLVKLEDKKKNESCWYWTLSPDMFNGDNDIYILSYMFDGSIMRTFLDAHQIEYTYIGIARAEDPKESRFADTPQPPPSYVYDIERLVHICEIDKLNRVGKNRTSLSANWYQKNGGERKTDEFKKLHSNLYSYFMYHMKDHPAEERLWSSYSTGTPKLRSKGYYRKELAFNTKATNKHKDCCVLAYCVNVFANPTIIHYLESLGGYLCDDDYALSTMVQWIWRSAIREGHEIWIYIPSRRMRNLLKKWMRGLAAAREGGDNDAA